ncbi:ATP-binding protein [Pseudomonadota bacterium]
MKELGFVIDTIFSYIFNYINFIGNEIAFHGNADPKKIASILKNSSKHIDQTREKVFHQWSMVDFVKQDGQVLASAIEGVIRQNKLMVQKERRCWMVDAVKEPWKLHICETDEEITTFEDKVTIIPFGMGVVNIEGKFLGIVSSGLNVDDLKKELTKVIQSDNYSFIVLDSSLNYILYSEDESKITKADKEYIKSELNYLKDKKENFSTLDETIFIDDVEYMFYTKAQQYPFVVIIGIKTSEIFDVYSLERKIVQLQKEGKYHQMFLLALVYLFQEKIINPIVNTNVITKERKFEIPKVFSTNVNDLFLALEQMEGFMEMKIQKEANEEIAEERKQLLEQRELFFEGIAHDIGNPLASIRSYLEFVKMEGGRFTEKDIEMIKQAVDNAKSLVDNILVVAKMKSGNLKLNRALFNLEHLIDEVIKANIYNVEGKKLYIHKEISKDIGEACNFFGDKQVMNRILTNLVTNAAKFTDKGGITISLYKDEEDNTVISVIDTGRGIKKENLEYVLEKFGQEKTGRENEGTGIGLPLVKKFVELHEGELKLESEFGKGTEAKIILNSKN